ncbi:MAG: L,D-transpeptidase Cds6 family protein [Candidatus Nitrospinota bacterium M3_3B_026]
MVRIKATAPFEYISYKLENPRRIAVEIPGGSSYEDGAIIPVGGDLVEKIHVIDFREAGAVRLEIWLLQGVDYETSMEDASLAVVIRPREDPELAAARARIEEQKNMIISLEKKAAAMEGKLENLREEAAGLEARAAILERENELLKKELDSFSENAAETGADGARDAEEQVKKTVRGWLAAWREKVFEKYGSYYAETFSHDGAGLGAWLERKRRTFSTAGSISVEVEGLRVSVGGGVAEVSFMQRYSSETYSDEGIKKLTMIWTDEGWRIESEEWRPAP